MGVECVLDPLSYLRIKHRLYGHKCFDIHLLMFAHKLYEDEFIGL